MASPAQIGIVVGDFHAEMAEVMISSARDEAARLGAEVTVVTRVSGSYEAPLLADWLLSRESIDALVVLGYIERGETLHGEVMGHVVHQALMQLQLQHKKPVGIGIIGPGATREQAEARKASYAAAAVRAALRSLAALGGPRRLRGPRAPGASGRRGRYRIAPCGDTKARGPAGSRASV